MTACKALITEEWPKINSLTLWAFEMNHTTNRKSGSESLESAGATLTPGYPPTREQTWLALGSISKDKLSTLNSVIGFRSAKLVVEISIQRPLRQRGKFDDLVRRLESEGFRWFHPGLAETRPRTLTGAIAPENFLKIGRIPGVISLTQSWFIPESFESNVPRSVKLEELMARVNVLGAELMIRGPSNQKVSGFIFLTGGMRLQERHDGNTMIQMSDAIEAYKKPFETMVEKWKDAGFRLSREATGFDVRIYFDGKEHPSNSSLGSLGELRKILRASPEIEFAYINQMARWTYRNPGASGD